MGIPGDSSSLASGSLLATAGRILPSSLDRLRGNPDFAVDQIIVIDDGSKTACPEEIKARFPGVTFLRDEAPKGYIAQRNRLGRILETDYYLSLDDDSFPIAGSLTKAADFMRTRPEIFCLAFNLVSTEAETPPMPVEGAPRQVRYFIGCAHLLDRHKFVEIGGYHEELSFYNEEWEISARIVGRGWQIVCYPAVVICHLRSMVNRFLRPSVVLFHARKNDLYALDGAGGAASLPARGDSAELYPLDGAPGLACCAQWRDPGDVGGAELLKQKRRPLSKAAYDHWRHCPWPPCQAIRTPDAKAA